ncbi:small redox-active disulfide protein 2 [Methanolinea mesophila]|uniref:thioredoxin family protein n=1 Tax=Methanolinea mesophila TaxID=547055 RepID=UPI001AE6C578|nr:thioredoxin family protein [Methanolinea mesophila]MBP1927600.1 small redox-active disulfide protein 2 [Methanolinea mesophila]
MIRIEVLGTGCVKCSRMHANVLEAVKKTGADAEVIQVKDINSIADRGVMLTPALVIDGVIRAEGRIPCVEEIEEMIQE